jgi:predicted phage terminase large subunit-like protein
VIDRASIQEIKRLKVAKVLCESSMLDFTRYFFRQRYGRKFVVNWHHEVICNALDRVISGEIKRLIINIFPRSGKTEIAVKNFIAYCLALNASAKFIHLSYSDDLALDNSEDVKNFITDIDEYRLMFPDVRLKRDTRGKKKWYTTASGGVYATSTGGQVTGFGAGQVDEEDADDQFELTEILEQLSVNKKFGGAIIIDDPMKPEDADYNLRRDRINMRFDSTIRNRVNSRNTPIIIIMQRLHPEDLTGYLLDVEPGEWEHISLPAIVDERLIETAKKYGVIVPDDRLCQPLWEFKMNFDELMKYKRINSLVFERQYMQDPQPLEGLIFPKNELNYFSGECPKGVPVFYADPADTGDDNYSMPIGVIANGKVYIDDVLFTQDNLNQVEPQVVHLVNKYLPSKLFIETNSFGRLHMTNIKTQVRRTTVRGVRNVSNKISRILAEEGWIKENFVFRKDYRPQSPYENFMKQIWWCLKNGKETRDDAPDSIAGLSQAIRHFYRAMFK